MASAHLEGLEKVPAAAAACAAAMQHVARHAVRAHRRDEQARERHGGGVPLPLRRAVWAGNGADCMSGRRGGPRRGLYKQQVGAGEREERRAEADNEDEVPAAMVGDTLQELVVGQVALGV